MCDNLLYNAYASITSRTKPNGKKEYVLEPKDETAITLTEMGMVLAHFTELLMRRKND